MKSWEALLLVIVYKCQLTKAFSTSGTRKGHLNGQIETQQNALPPDDGDTYSSFRRDLIAGMTATATSLFLPTLRAHAVAKDLKEEYRQGTSVLSNMDSDAPVPREAYRKLPNGIVYADVRQGNGPEVKEGSKLNLQWVLRKSNGYFVDSSERNQSVPFIFTVGDKGAAIEGVNQGVVGMKEGGVRRILIPPSLAYAQGLEDGKPGPLPQGFGPRQQMRRVQEVRQDVPGEYVYLEMLATRVR